MVTLRLIHRAYQDWLRIGLRPGLVTLDDFEEQRPRRVADWSQARIGYTGIRSIQQGSGVADWSQARIGYTLGKLPILHGHVADWSQARIGYTATIR